MRKKWRALQEDLDFLMETSAAIADLYERHGVRGLLTHAAMAAVGEYCIIQARKRRRKPEEGSFEERLEELDELVEEIATAEDPRAALQAAAVAILAGAEDPDLPSLHRALAVLVLVYLAARDRRAGQGSTFQAALAAMEAIEAVAELLEEGDPG